MERDRRTDIRRKNPSGCSVDLEPGQEMVLPSKPWERPFGKQSFSQLSKNSENMQVVSGQSRKQQRR